ncbi:MAG: hypothetical protein JWP55_4667 [Mycobacterium sp.]|nr:hypothetical protein [Mycobacterium sp.]
MAARVLDVFKSVQCPVACPGLFSFTQQCGKNLTGVSRRSVAHAPCRRLSSARQNSDAPRRFRLGAPLAEPELRRRDRRGPPSGAHPAALDRGVSPGRVSRSAAPARAQKAAEIVCGTVGNPDPLCHNRWSVRTPGGVAARHLFDSRPSRRSAEDRTLVAKTSTPASNSRTTRRPSSVADRARCCAWTGCQSRTAGSLPTRSATSDRTSGPDRLRDARS